MEKNKLRKNILRLWDVEEKIEEIMNIRYSPRGTAPHVRESDTATAVMLFNEETKLKNIIRKEI